MNILPKEFVSSLTPSPIVVVPTVQPIDSPQSVVVTIECSIAERYCFEAIQRTVHSGGDKS